LAELVHVDGRAACLGTRALPDRRAARRCGIQRVLSARQGNPPRSPDRRDRRRRRLLDTILGCAIALAATYLLWPKDRENPETIPVPAT
jgi:hypothetical protein